MHPAEQLIEEAIVTTPRGGLDTDAMHDLLLRIADWAGGKPVRLTDAGFLFRLDDRAVTIRGGYYDARYHPSMTSDSWQGLDDHEHRAFKNVLFVEDQPYLWRLDLTRRPGDRWPGKTVVRNWTEFFNIFSIYNSLPAELDAIPPAWRPEPAGFGCYIESSWNNGTQGLGSFSIHAGPGKLVLYGMGAHDEYYREIPLAAIGRNGVDAPALIAGMAADGKFADLNHFDTGGRLSVFPTTPGWQMSGPTPEQASMDDGEAPPRVQTLAELDELLAKPAETKQPEPVKPTPAEQFSSVDLAMSGAQWVDLIDQLVTATEAEPLLAAAGIDPIRYQARPGGRHQVEFGPDQRTVDEAGAWEMGNRVTRELVARHGMPCAVSAGSGRVRRLWRLGKDAGAQVDISAFDPGVSVAPFETLLASYRGRPRRSGDPLQLHQIAW